jgi:nucleoid DNA-binding protein
MEPTRTYQKASAALRSLITQTAEMAPMMKSTVMTKSALTAALAESCEVKRGVISTALSTLASIAATEAKKNGKFVIPGVVAIKTRQKKATKAGKREIFGKMVMVKAKPAKTIVKAFPAKALKDEF